MKPLNGISAAFDFDGVVADSEEAKIYFARERYGITNLVSPVKRQIVVEQKKVMTPEQYLTMQQEVYGKWEYGCLMKPVAGVISILPALYNEGCRMFIITSRADEELPMLSVAVKWLREWGLFQYIQEVKSAGYKKSKAPLLSQINPVIYMDDDQEKLLPLKSVVKNLVLFSKTHNLEQELPDFVERVASWEEFYEFTCELGLLVTAASCRIRT